MTNPWGKPDANRSIIIYVPSTERDKKITPTKFKKRIRETIKFLNRLFGGTTRVRGIGSYTDPGTGKVISEKVAIVETMTTDSMLRKKGAMLRKFVQKKKRDWKQISVAVEYEEDMKFI